jgi:Nucleotidyl transferase AbiEii toxin, Type IV TA system
MIYAEKIVTMLEHGAANSRWRDFVDLYLLPRQRPVDGDDLRYALTEVAMFRAVELRPLADVLDGYTAVAQQRWAAWRRKQRLDDRVPESFAEVLDSVVTFADPVLSDDTSGRVWEPARGWVLARRVSHPVGDEGDRPR